MKRSSNKLFLYLSILFLTLSSAVAQEICTNGTDDDGDGFIDCYDGDCAGGPSCSDFFYGNPIVCRDEPTQNPTFAMRLQWGSEDRSADSHATPAVGDLDNDNLPEVVVINRLDERLFILNGEDGTTAFTYDLGYQPENGIVLANLDGGSCGNIYVSRDNSTTITALDCEANLLWETNASDRVGIMGIADFNGDGNAELYYKTEIMDAATGAIVVPGTGDNWVQKYAHSAIAVDILDDSFCADCSGLELITGNQIWAINIASGTRTLAKDLNNLFAAEVPINNKRYYTKYFNTTQNRTMISVADYNLDGHVDVLMPGAYGSSNSSQTTIFLWDVFNNTYLVYTGGVNHSKGTGRLNVADIDGDGLMNTTYVSDQILYALDENLNVIWTKGIDEGSSGFTGTTVFDFDGDGASETIYRSESYLYIIDGTDGSTRTTIPCVSRTQEEYPLVADVDNDGSSELCVPCYTSNNTPFSPYSNTRYSQIRIYEADAGEIWQPSRRVWNQHGYFVVNVNDDLTIPAQQQDHTAIFGTENCETGAPEDNRALNGFLNQTTFLEADGCPSYVSPDITFAGNISATPSACPETTFTVSFDIENTGDTDIYGNLPVTFYDGDPETPGATRLNTEFVSFASGLAQGDIETVNLTVQGSGGNFDLYVSLNNSGQNPPISLSGSGFPECDFSNNIGSVSVTYTPFTLTVNKLEDNRRCDLTKPNNGEAEAYFEGVLGGSYETFWVEDFAGLPNGDRSDAGSTAWTSSKGSVNPTYWGVNTKSGNKVYQTRNTGTSNETGEVTWLSEVIDISGHTDVDLSLEMLTNNALEASGQWRDYMRAFYILDGGAAVEFDTNGELYGSFLYAIAEQQDLNGSTVQIKVTFHSTANGEYQYLDNVQVSGVSIPVVQQYTDADGFEFDWYNAGDFSAPVGNGSLYAGMPTGSYDVVGYFPGGNCYSDTVSVTINDVIPTVNVHVYEVAPYTDCADPDGALSAFVYTQTDVSGDPLDTLTLGYSFQWRRSTEGITIVGTGPNLTNITSEEYDVTVTEAITGCIVSVGNQSVSSSVVFPPDPDVVPVDIFACSGPGSTGSASASVGGITAGYDFEWYYENIDASPDYTGASISGLLEGTYYVQALDAGSGCPSSFTTFDIMDTSADPSPVAVEIQADSECGGNNGIATVDGDGMGTTAGYMFEWFLGAAALPAQQLPGALPGSSISADGATASGLANGLYTVRASIAGCDETTTVNITDAEVIPTYNIISQVPAGNALEVTDKANVEMPQLLSGTSSFTMSYWVEISTQNYLDDHRIFSSGGKNEAQVMLWTSDVFGIAFVVKAESAGTVGRINTFYKPTGWVQLTGTWDEASGEMKLYANGVKIGEITYFGDDPAVLEGVIDNGPIMYLARDGNLGVNKFEGRIDEVKIYNRVLDETEILTVLCDPAGGSTTGLQVHYDFNGALATTNGSPVPDVSGNGNDGILAKPGAAAGTWSYPLSGIQCPLVGMVNNTSCDPANPNGEINLVGAVDPQPASYEYFLYDGTEVDPGMLRSSNTTGVFPDLPDGFYTVVTQDQVSNCETDPLTLSIATLPEEPSIVTSITDNTGCSVGNGEILVSSSSISAEPSSYTYELYDGYTFSTLLQTETVADGSTGFNFTGLLDGEYRIRVVNDDILCEDYVDVFVDDASVNPTWNHPSTIENDNTVCAGTPNGFASVAPVGSLANFIFVWYTGELVDPGQLIAGENAEFIDELSAGKYTVVATNINTGCETPPKTVTINLAPEYPNVVVVEVQPQNSCDVGDGILRAYVDEPDPSDCVECTEVDDYSFQWFLGNDTSTPLIEATDPGNNSNPTFVDSSQVEGLTGGYEYTVLVTNNLTGCTNEGTLDLTYDPLPPTIDAANSKVTANTLCGPVGNGSVVAAVNFVGETINGAINDKTWDIITDCNTVTDLNSSILPDGSIELTPDVNNQAGKAYLGDSVDFSTPTRIDFLMYLGDKDNGADGITFIFHQDPDGRDALGRYGCNLGIGDESCFGGTETAIQPSVAVEFDTYNNGGATKDPSYDHAAFVINGDMSEPQGDVGVFYNANQPRIVNGQNDVEAADTELRVTITIVPNMDGTQTFSVYVEDELRLQRTQDFINDLFGGNPKTIGGFTASTGGARNQQYVRLDPYFGEYDFDWYTGSGVNPANEILGADRPFLCDLLAGDYTLVVTYNASGCTSSPPVTFTVPNDTDSATVSFSGTSNTVCDPALALGGTYTGSLSANIPQNPADYVFAWFEGTAPTTDTLATTQSINNIPGGDYTVVVESLDGGCITIRDTTLVDVTVDPAIVNVSTDVTINNVTACEGATTYPNGSVTVNTVGIGTGPFGFWYYYGADTTTGTFLIDASDIFTQTSTPGTASVNVNGNGTSTITGLSAGDYTIIVIDSASGCTSVEANVQIIDVPTIPNLDQTVTPNSVCDPALAASGVYDGEVEITTTDGSDAVADYTYLWYDGTGTTTPTSWTVNNNILSEAPDGNYTVVATSNSTQCDTTIYATIGDATVDPAITSTSVTNVTSCEGGVAYPNGSITISGVTGTGPFGYLYWAGADTTTGTFLVDGVDIFTQTSTAGIATVNVNGNGTATLTGLSAGDYTIIVIDSASGCTSIEANETIINIPTIPSLDKTITNNTVCDISVNNSGVYDGEVEIFATDATDETTDYSYVWYDGTGTTTPTVYNDNINILSEAPEGNYTVVATSLITGCDTTIYATIGDATVDPVIGTVNVTDMSVCSSSAIYPNGGFEVVEATVTNGSGDYSYEFYWGPTVNPARLLADGDNIVFEKTGFVNGVNIDITDNIITNLDTGFYTIVLIDNVTGCPATEVSVEIDDVLIPININLSGAITHWTNCATPNGAIPVVASMSSGPPPAGGFTYEWFYGSGTSNPLDVGDFSNGGNPVGVNTSSVSGLEDGTYTVEVTNNDTECTEIAEFDVEDQRVYPTLTGIIGVTDNTNCSGPVNGIIDPSGAFSPAGAYSYELFDASMVSQGTSATTFTDIAAGNYSVVATVSGTGCTTVTPAAVVVEDDLTNPSVNHSIVSHETSCIAPNGQISISSPGGVPPTGGWDINLYQGSGNGGALQENIATGVTAGFPLSSTANLDNGLYTIEIINNQTGCDSLKEITILEILDRPTGISATRTNNTFCTSDNGSVTITGITNGGATPIYNIYAGSTVTGSPDSTSTDNLFENLPAGPYTVTVTKAESGCESTGVTRTISNTPITITGTVSLISDQTSCDLTDPNGQLTANPTSQSSNPVDFTFEWFQGQNTNPSNAIPASAVTGAVLSGTNNQTVTGLPAGTYRVRITNTESGCFTTVDRSIIISTVNPSVAAAPTTVPNTSCVTPDGEISITIQDNSAAINDGAAGYTFELFEGTSISPSSVPVQTVPNATPSPTTQVFIGLLDGDYIIRATDNNTDCKVVSIPVTVGYSGITATFDQSLFFKQAISACFDEDGIIDVSAGTTLGGAHGGPINITWYAGTDTSNAVNLLSNLHNVVTLSHPVDFQDVVVSGVTIQNGRIGDGDNITTGGLPAISYTGVVTLSNGCIQLISTNLTLGSAPDVVTSVSVPNTRCATAFDGEIDITMDVQPGNNPAEYNWFLFEGAQTISPDANGVTPFFPDLSTYGPVAASGSFLDVTDGAMETVFATGLASGEYTLGIEFDADQCITHVSTIIIDDPELPELTLNNTINNSVCDVSGALDYNGAIVVDAIHNTLGGTFDFTWYYDIDGDGDFTGGDQTLIANGVNGAGAGSNVTGATTTNDNTAGISGIGPGWYRVIAIHNDGATIPPATACPDTLDIQIFDETVDVTAIAGVDYTFNDMDDCNGFGDFNLSQVNQSIGGVTTVNGTVAADYTITWTKDGAGFIPDTEVSDADLMPGDYSLELVQDTTGCSTTIDFTIEDITVDPVIELVLLTENTTCPGGANAPTGSIEVQIVDGGGTPVPVAGEYAIEWYENPALTIDLGTTVGIEAGVDNEQATQLPAGTYYVEVTDINAANQNDACVASAMYTVVDNPATLSIQSILGTDIARQNQTDCSPENGNYEVLRVLEDGSAVNAIGDYTFGWFTNSAATNTIATAGLGATFPQGGNGPEVADLPFGTYYVAATNINNDCVSDTISFSILDQRVIPNVQVTQVLPDTTCIGSTIPSGEVIASVTLPGGGSGNTADYSFTWYQGGAVDANFLLDNVTPGPLVTVTGYTIGGTNDSEVDGLTAGQYTVEVEDNVTPGDGCIATTTITVSRFTPILSIQTADITKVNDTDCSGDNGSATVNAITVTKFGGGSYKVLPADFGDWAFRWYTVSTGGVPVNLTNSYAGLAAGTYYVEVENNLSGCIISSRKAVTIQENIQYPLVQLVSKTPDEYCATVTPNEGDGALLMKIVHEGFNPADSTDYAITWYRGTGTGTLLTAALGSATISPNRTGLSGLSTGTYTVVVSKTGTPNDGCTVTQTFTINRDAPTYSLPQSAMTLQDNQNCTGPNGTITINGVNIDGIFEDFGTTADTYTINWPSLPGGAMQNTINQGNDQVTNLPGGTYAVDIENDRTGCTVSANITIDDDTSNPLIQLVAKSADTYCTTVTPFEGDGWLNIKVVHEGNNPADSTNYTFTWYRGTGTGTTLASTLGSAVVSPNGTGVTGLSAGTYTVNISKNGAPNNACNTTQTFTINRDAPTVSLPLSAMTIQNNLNCGNPNGSITIDGIVIDGVFDDFSTSPDTYTINWTGLPGGAILNTVNFTDDQVTGIVGGVYTVDVENDRTGCSVTANIVVNNITSNPLIQLVIKQADEYCDNTGFQGNGSLEMRIVHEGNNPANPLDYNITWYRGTGTGTTLASTAGSSAVAGNGTILSGLSTGTYTVTVVKNGIPNDQCQATTTFSIVKDPPLFSIQSTSVQKLNNSNCTNPNGSIQITNVVTDGVVTDISTVPIGTYSFQWIPAGLNGGFNSTMSQTNDRADNLPAGTYNIIASNLVTGCSTDTISVVVQDDPTEPVLSWSMDSENTYCGPTKNGQLTVTATTSDGNPVTNVGRYSFTWYDGQGTTNPTGYIQNDGIGVNDNQSTLLALDSGYYTVTVFDNVNECSVTGTYAVSETLDQPRVLLSEIVVRADTTCNAGSSGTIIVADSSFVTGVLDDFDVEIRSGSATGAIVGQSTAGSGNTDLTVSSLDPGTFYVTATRAASECPAAPVRVIILDQRIPPAILLNTLIPNPNCGGTIALGSISVTANGFDETNPNYLFQWYDGTIAGGIIVPGGNGGNTATMFNMNEGQYELQVINVNTGCIATQLFDLPAQPVNPRISSYSVSNNLICNLPGDGSFEINQIRWNGNFFDVGITADSLNIVTNYTFEYFSDAGLTTPVIDIDLTTPLQLDGLSAGTYYARVRRNDSQCASGPIQFTIQNLPQFPVIQLSQIEADSTCNGMNPNGSLTALVDGVRNDILYTYDWYEVDPGTGTRISGSLGTNDTISGLATGRYELEVTGLSTGCVSTAQRNVTNAPIEVEILAITSTDPTSCNPPNGQIEVTSITPGVLGDYDFTFYLGDPGSGGVQVQTGLGPVYAGGTAGTYYVEATHVIYGCVNNLNEVELEDNLVYPDISLVSFTNQTNCDPGNPNGELFATADGTTNTVTFTFEWRDSTNTVVAANSPNITNVPAGAYTLNVTNNSTGCVSSSTFDIINDFPLPLRLVISTSPNTNCIDPNGEASATIRNLQALGKPITNYIFYWFIGDQTDPLNPPDIANPDFQGTLWTDLPAGDFTVKVVDAGDVFCQSAATLVTIPDLTLPPPFEIEVQNHVTICYDSLPDGRARISPTSLEPNRSLFEFRYEWYVGTAADTAGQTPFVTGIRADSLDVATYSVVSIDLRTGCRNLVTFDIIDAADAIPAPDVNVIADRDNCLFPNGIARASISGTISGYRFEWFQASGDTTTVQFTGHEIGNLDGIQYMVQATRLSTGCVSPKTPVDVEDISAPPAIQIRTTTSMCLRTEDGSLNQFTGTAEIVFEQFEVIKEIDWIAPDGTVYSNDIKLVNAQPGCWSVRVLTDKDCETTGSFTIETELKIYNGVSANADGRNDYFFVDCIDNFPNNKVQIFNRDGTRVWENEGYDNNSVRFDGFSNVGRTGLQLPAGTYFYIIEKGPPLIGGQCADTFTDNTIRPRIQGYLELVR